MYSWADVSRFSWKDRAKSFGYAASGLRVMLRTQHNAWIHVSFSVLAVGLGFALGISVLEWCAIAGVIALVWIAEALNTALEALADALMPERHPKIAVAKDAAAGAVLVAAVAAVVVGGLVFGPRLLAGLFG